MTDNIVEFPKLVDESEKNNKPTLAQVLRNAADRVENDDTVQRIVLCIDMGDGGQEWWTGGSTTFKRLVMLMSDHISTIVSGIPDLKSDGQSD